MSPSFCLVGEGEKGLPITFLHSMYNFINMIIALHAICSWNPACSKDTRPEVALANSPAQDISYKFPTQVAIADILLHLSLNTYSLCRGKNK